MPSKVNNKKWEKEILEEGQFGEKPTENCVCKILISDIISSEKVSSEIIKHELVGEEQTVVIGELDTNFDRIIQKCLETMLEGELARVKIQIANNTSVFSLKLVKLNFQGFFHKWRADIKYRLALKHKDRGVDLFKENRYIDAFYRFSKAIRLLLTCVLEVDDESDEIESVKLADIEVLKTILYGNLASCQLKAENFQAVVDLCTQVLIKDSENVKAIYKRGLGYMGVKDFEKAEADLVKFLNYEPNNAFIQNKLVYVRQELIKSHEKYVNMCERMFR